ncbi:MAG: phage tail protein [Candidatus Brocadiaceae bacterium]|nr:phage tail protein [Candidatus Brocadiaceae bacterium]
MSIVELLREEKNQQSRIYGVVTGIVTNNSDPDGLGRVKVKIPRINNEDESNWARVVSFMAGKERGGFFLPEVDDEVLVAFEFGDINMLYVIGALWNGVDKPPETNGDGKNNKGFITSRSGHIIRLNDEDGKEMIEIVDKTEKNSIVFDTAKNTITISTDKDITLSAPQGTVKIEAQKIELKSSAEVKIEAGSTMDVKSSAMMTVKCATVNIN